MFFRFSSLSAIALGFASGGRLQPRAARKNVGLFGIWSESSLQIYQFL
jgi:hypothetical protein